MASRFGKLTLRDLFWLILLSAIAMGWYLERTRATKQLAKYQGRWMFSANNSRPSAESVQRRKLLKELGALNNEQLNVRFSKAKPASPYGSTDEYSCCLNELARRRMHAELQIHYDNLLTSGSKDHGGPADALLLTALRRAQGKPDPLSIHVELDSALRGEQADQRPIPAIKATLKNVDAQPISITRGGDYRSGRQTRWRVHLTNEQAVRIADSNFPLYGMGGGISSFGPLASGEAIDNYGPLDARCYVKSPPSGRYQLQVVYSEQEIAAEPDLAGLIVWQSPPINVQVINRTGTDEQRFTAVPLLSILAIGGLVFVVAAVRRRPAADSTSAPRRWLLNGRDLVALALLVGLTAGWLLDTQRLFAEIERQRTDRDAEWSMKVAE